MTPPTEKLEADTRREIDAKLRAAGWVVQDKAKINLVETLGVAVREMDAFVNQKAPDGAGSYRKVPLGCTDTGPADYMLFIDGKACGVIEAKREGAQLGGVAEQSARYAVSTVKHIQRWVPEDQPLPFLFEATNHEIRFRDERDPHPRSRYIFHFQRPETLLKWLEDSDTLRCKMQQLPELNTENLRNCQIDAITGIEHSLKAGKPRALLQMATGSGKAAPAHPCARGIRTSLSKNYTVQTWAKWRVYFMKSEAKLTRKILIRSDVSIEEADVIISHECSAHGCANAASTGCAGAANLWR